MSFLVLLTLVAAMAALGLLVWRWLKQVQVQRLRDRARLKAIEGQLAGLRAALRIQVAERVARQWMQSDPHVASPLAHSTVHDGPEAWQ
jgi:hypothetical protein